MKPTMMIYSAEWNSKETFKLLPIEPECVFIEGIYDTESKVLVLFSKEQKDSLHMIPKLNDDGEPIPSKNRDKKYREQRINIRTYNEYLLRKPEEIEAFLKTYVANIDSYDYKTFIFPKEEKKLKEKK